MTALRAGVLSLSLMAALSVFPSGAGAQQKVDQFTVVNVEYEGTKIWLPSTLFVHKGDKVKVKLINNVKADPNQHGFAIPAFNVEAVVTRGEPKENEFTADKTGGFPISCQLPPAHLGRPLAADEEVPRP